MSMSMFVRFSIERVRISEKIASQLKYRITKLVIQYKIINNNNA